MPALRIYRPLPPQPWGWLPTDQFWARALWTPIALIYWPAYVLYFSFAMAWGLPWWQTALAVGLIHQIWGGLVERLTRQWLARRHRRMLTAEVSMASSVTEEVPTPTPGRVPIGAMSVASSEELSTSTQGLDDYEALGARLFGKHKLLVHNILNFAFLFLIFYPRWWTTVLGVLWIIGLTWLVRASARRRRRISSADDPVLRAAPAKALAHDAGAAASPTSTNTQPSAKAVAKLAMRPNLPRSGP